MAEPEIASPGSSAAVVLASEEDKRETKNETTNPSHRDARSEDANEHKAANDSFPSPDAFVNNGLLRWQAARSEWCSGGGSPASRAPASFSAVQLDVDEVIDVLFDPRWRGGPPRTSGSTRSLVPPRFPKNVPLPQMIDVLTDLWEAEGLDV
ncbi:unnamed protein product [Pseudo-nitzschia multistriata]|uniref:DUF4050 domain-containing protein n=1 Tax=Pseudo-nitzschia multistriata TaxID=183589 RepID=A0A448ZS03_9STRA|nr:unnamed protein product [Pseudo-nitzschia multistriata]